MKRILRAVSKRMASRLTLSKKHQNIQTNTNTMYHKMLSNKDRMYVLESPSLNKPSNQHQFSIFVSLHESRFRLTWVYLEGFATEIEALSKLKSIKNQGFLNLVEDWDVWKA